MKTTGHIIDLNGKNVFGIIINIDDELLDKFSPEQIMEAIRSADDINIRKLVKSSKESVLDELIG